MGIWFAGPCTIAGALIGGRIGTSYSEDGFFGSIAGMCMFVCVRRPARSKAAKIQTEISTKRAVLHLASFNEHFAEECDFPEPRPP